ncbi:MAG: V-type ATP synthase subunit E [Thermoplasmatota archaeon]
MSEEMLIAKIKEDAQKAVQDIIDEATKQSKQMIKQAQGEAKRQAETILQQGTSEKATIQRIKISQAQQEAKRQLMQAKEHIIEECFQKAVERLKNLDDKSYSKMIESLIKKGSDQMSGSFIIYTSKPLDALVAKKQNIPVKGTLTTYGGIILHSEDGRIIVDNTFEGILQRKKDILRVQVGRLLFS